MKIERIKCDRCGDEDGEKTFTQVTSASCKTELREEKPDPSGYGLFNLSYGRSPVASQTFDLCASCAEAFRTFMLGAAPPARDKIKPRTPQFVLDHLPPLDKA